MELHFLGANRQVTGSRYCLTANGEHVMIDCGLVQEREFLSRNWAECPISAGKVKALLLTHVHIDHCGLIPRFVREGFKGRILATRPTVDLADVVLRDSAHIQHEDAAYKKKRHHRERRHGKHPEVPLYERDDVERTLPLFRGIDYGQSTHVADGISVTFHDAGHILGSAMLEVIVEENGTKRSILFSGDIGQNGKPLIGDPTLFDEADYVVMESTYGNRDHDSMGDVESQLGDVINETIKRGGNVVIPTFAIERAQELMYYISQLVNADRIPDIPVFLDSPMAVDVTEIFRRHREYCDEETWELFALHEPPLRFPGLKLVRSVEDSKAIFAQKKPCIIMSAAGMCNAGRIKHHLRQNIGRWECTILFVGYQARGTLGRQIVDGRSPVRIHGEMRRVRARVAQIHGLSAHADRTGLLHWLGHLKRPPRHVFLAHGEEDVSLAFADEIDRELGWPVSVPRYGDVVELC